MGRKNEYDIAIVGAGPAGSAAAILLAMRGCRVVLFERHRYPHDKLCGEFLSPETEPMFRRLRVWDEVSALHPARLTEVLITAAAGGQFRAPLPGAAIGLSRLQMDALLAAAAARAGATFRDGTPVLSIAGSLVSGFEVAARSPAGGEEVVSARVVLGAWGKRGSLDRTLERPFFQKYHPYLGVKAHYVSIETATRVELHGFRGGYVGMAAIEDGLTNVCLLATESAFEAAGRAPERLLDHSARQNPIVADRLEGAERTSDLITISQIAFGPKAPVERDILMIGDTAELISPLAGNGMAMALRAAELAVPPTCDFLSTGDAGRLVSSYSRAWRREFRTRLALGRLIQPLFLRPRLLAVGLSLLRFAPPVGDLLIQGTRDTGAVSTQ